MGGVPFGMSSHRLSGVESNSGHSKHAGQHRAGKSESPGVGEEASYKELKKKKQKNNNKKTPSILNTGMASEGEGQIFRREEMLSDVWGGDGGSN